MTAAARPMPADLLRRMRAQLRDFSPRGLLLYALPLPLFLALPISLLRGDYAAVAGQAAALALLLGGAALARRGMRAEARWRRRRVARAPLPRKTLAAVLVAAGTAVLAAFAIGHPLLVAAGLGAAAFAGFALAYGLDPARAKSLPPDAGTTLEELERAVDDAGAAIACLEAVRARLGPGEPALRLGRITGLAREVVAHVEEDPRELRRARRFLTVLLPGAREVCEGFADAPPAPRAELDERFRHVLAGLEEAFAAQREKLLEHDAHDLDVQIEVLARQLRAEGVAVRRDEEPR